MNLKQGIIFEKTYKPIAIILLIAFFIRMLGITSRPIWYDEAFAILFAEKGPAQMLYGTLAPTGAGSADIHPLGYYTILWLWMNVFGNSIIATRALSILAGLGVVLLAYLITLEFFDAKTAYTAALIVSLSPFQIHYAQEIRMYSFLALWLLLTVYAFIRGSRSGKWQWWAVFAISSALAQYTHNLAAFFLIALALIPLIKRDWKTLRSVFLFGCFAILLYFPWLIQLPSQFAKVSQAYWVVKPDVSRLFTLLLFFTTNIPLHTSWILPGLMISTLVLIIGLLQTYRNRQNASDLSRGWVFYLTFFPPLLLFLFSQWKPVYVERALLPSGVFFCIWLAWVIQKTDLPAMGQYLLAGLLMIAFTTGIDQHLRYRGFPYGPFQEINSYIAANALPSDKIIHSNKLSYLPSFYFNPALEQVFISDPPNSTTDTLAPATQEVLNIFAKPDIESATKGAGRVWYIIYQQSIDEFTQAGRYSHPDIEYLDLAFTLEEQKTFNDALVLLYTKIP